MAEPIAALKAGPHGIRLAVRLMPRGGRDALEGWDQDSSGRAFLKARVRALPEDGKANDALVELLAKALDVARSDIAISSGAKARLKMVEIKGDPNLLTRRLTKSGDGM